MTNKLQTIAKEITSQKLTENGAFAYNTTGDALLDLFGTAGALRPRQPHEIETKFSKAFSEDALLATKMLFYIGNIRGGLGERRTFRICLKWLALHHPEIMQKNISLIPHYNRWDSIFELLGTPVEEDMWELLVSQLNEDFDNYLKRKPISLLAKWMPSENASSSKTKRLARIVRQNLGYDSKEYRQVLSELRKYLKITETYMSANEWDKIEYETVPSKAMLNYRNAFAIHNKEGFTQYINNLKSGTAKINAKTLYPYDLVKTYTNPFYNKSVDEICEAQWKALPNYISEETNILVMADVSGSMLGRPMDTSIGLATYFAERNHGPLEGVYMTFTNNPHFITLDKEDSLKEKVRKVQNTDIGYNTNLEKAFDYLLNIAKLNSFSQEDMPAAIVVISDMEIDYYVRAYGYNFVTEMEIKYLQAGYKMPKLVMWNVESRQDTFLTKNKNVIMVSGQSAATFETLMGNLDGVSAFDVLLKTLNNPMYDMVTI